MKSFCIIFLICITQLVNSYSQDKADNILYSVGIGFGNENNVSNYGIFFTNDIKIEIAERLSLNPRVSFFQSLGSIESEGYRSHSGIFLETGLSYSIKKNGKVELSVNAGPSLEIGDETYSSLRRYEDGVLVEERFGNNMLKQFGFYGDFEISWKRDRCLKTIGLRTNYYGIYPEFLGIVYKIGFNL